jgi:hypothetical protein
LEQAASVGDGHFFENSSVPIMVTRLDEYLPFGRLFSLDSVMKNSKVSHFLASFFHGKSFILIWTRMAWAILCVIFSQTHLVTLVSICTDHHNLCTHTRGSISFSAILVVGM